MTVKKVEEFRYYEMPVGRYDLALLGDSWITTYRTGEQHFHNFYEIGYCYFGEGVVFLGDKSEPYRAGTISLIPSNFPHGVQGGQRLPLGVAVSGFCRFCRAQLSMGRVSGNENFRADYAISDYH